VPQIFKIIKSILNMKKLFLVISLLVLGCTIVAQHQHSPDPKLEVKGATTVIIQTNAYSSKSNEIFATNLPYVKGIKEFNFDEKTSKIAVVYDQSKTNVDAIRKAITKLGFDADEVKADANARTKLPAECTTMPKGCSRPCGHHH
jgi:copper chaperone CopZ